LLRPDIFEHPDYAISYFGSPGPAAPAYYIGFAIIISCLVVIITQLPKTFKMLRFGFLSAAVCLTGIVLTSYPQGQDFLWTHGIFSVALVVSQSIAVVWIIRRQDASAVDYVLAFAFWCAVILGLISSRWIALIPGLSVFPEILLFSADILLLGRTTLRLLSAEQKAT